MTNLINFTTPKSDFGLAESETVFPVTRMPIVAMNETLTTESSSTHVAVVRQDTNQIVGIVSEKYGLLENGSFFGSVEETINRLVPEHMRKGVQIRERTTGNWSSREYVFPEYAHTLRNSIHETKVGLRIIARNSYDGSESAKIIAGLIDFFCTNGCVAGKGIEIGTRRHTSRITSNDLIAPLTRGIENVEGMVAELQKMIQTPITRDDAVHVLEKGFSGRRSAEILEQFDREVDTRGMNVFALHSAMTHFASHQDGYASRGEWSDRTLVGREDNVLTVVNSAPFRQLLAA